MLRYGMICFVCCLMAAVALGETKKVVTRNPERVIIGEVTETADGYEVKTPYGVIKLQRHQVVSITDVVDPKEEYDERLGELAEDDVDGHVELARWAMKNELVDEAEVRLKHVLELEPGHPEATLLLRQIADDRQPPSQNNDPTTPPEGDDPDPTFDPAWLVSIEDVYRIRMAEIAEDEKIRVKFVDDVLDDFSKMMAGETVDGKKFDSRKFRRLKDEEQLAYILANTDRDDTSIRDRIHITKDPAFMREFAKIWDSIDRSCAATQCHGGVDAPGGLKLLESPSGSRTGDVGTRTYYTNFLILDQYRVAEGQYTGEQLLNRNRPEDSLLLQFGLEPEEASFVHPEVDGKAISVLFRSAEDRNYEDAMDWIRNSLRGPVHPFYNVDFTPPVPNSDEDEEPAPTEPAEPAPTESSGHGESGESSGHGEAED